MVGGNQIIPFLSYGLIIKLCFLNYFNRYFALEPYISTLYDYCNGHYDGPPLPSEPQVIDQMISGIDYLHKEKYPHGDLNPLNIIISRDGRIKLSDFGLSKFSYTRKSDQHGDLSIESGIPEICRRKYWMKWTSGQDNECNYELVNDDNENVFPTEEADIFAVGCSIVYFLLKGVHPFGDDIQAIENNLENKNPINLESKL
jgi:serine/threonine protein kinase